MTFSTRLLLAASVVDAMVASLHLWATVEYYANEIRNQGGCSGGRFRVKDKRVKKYGAKQSQKGYRS